MNPHLDKHDALIIVDMQNDFCPGGALPVQDCDSVVITLNRWIECASQAGAKVIASRDWHPPDHSSFQGQGGKWPRHCMQETPGAQFRPDLHLPPDVLVVSKGTQPDRDSYSVFEDTVLAEELQNEGIIRLWIGGVALEVCVRATALDSLRAGFEVHLIRAGTSPVDKVAGRRALREMEQAGIIIETEHY